MSTLPEKIEDQYDFEAEDLADIQFQSEGLRVDQIPLKISAVLGKVKMDIATLQSLNDGSVIELDRKVGDPIDLYVNDRLIGRGELMMIDGTLGVTLTEIVKDED